MFDNDYPDDFYNYHYDNDINYNNDVDDNNYNNDDNYDDNYDDYNDENNYNTINKTIKNIGKYLFFFVYIYLTILFDENVSFGKLIILMFPCLLIYGLYIIFKFIFSKLFNIIYYLLTIDKDFNYFIIMFIIILLSIKLFYKIN